MTPTTRIEHYLAKLGGEDVELPSPVTRIEHYLDIICGNDAEIPTPVTREEHYLAKIAGADVEIPTPVTRIEMYFAAIAGEDVEVPDPVTREEYWLSEWAGGGSYITLVGDIVRFMASRSAPFRKLQIALEPIQDLHGYDSPWPAGGGANVLDPNITLTSEEVDGVTLTTTDGYQFKVVGTATGSSASIFRSELIPFGSGKALKAGTYSLPTGITAQIRKQNNGNFLANATGTFTVEEDFYVCQVWYIVSVGSTVDLSRFIGLAVGSTAPTAWQPYSNICPISGRTSATVTRTGVNVWDEQMELGGLAGGTGQPYSANDRMRSVNYCSCVPDTSYYLFNNATGVYLFIWWFDESKNFISTAGGSSAGAGQIVTSPSNAKYFKLTTYAGNYIEYNNNFSINYPSTATAYEPYSGNTYTIQLGQTVYGGTLDVTAGTLTVDRAMVDLETLTWRYNQASLGGFDSDAISSLVAGGNNAVSSVYPNLGLPMTTSNINAHDVFYRINKQSNGTSETGNFALGTLFIKDTRYTTVEAFTEAVTGQKLVYELATPIEITLTPQVINSLVGENNVWDDGTLTVEVKGEAIT